MNMHFFDILPDELIIFHILKPDQLIHKLLLCSITNKNLNRLVKTVISKFVYNETKNNYLLNYKEILKFISQGFRMIKVKNNHTHTITFHYIVNFQLPRILTSPKETCYTITTADGTMFNVYPLTCHIQPGNISNQYKFDWNINGEIIFLVDTENNLFNVRTTKLEFSQKL